MSLEEGLFYSWAGRPIADIIAHLGSEQRIRVNIQQVAKEYESYFRGLPKHRLQPVHPVVEIDRHFRGRLSLAIAADSTTESASTSLEAIGVLH